MKVKPFAIALLLFPILAIISCSGSKEAREFKRGIKGSWILETVTTEGIPGKPSAKLFNEASFNCFIGSDWTFVANNGTGTYRINQSGSECDGISRKFRWTIYEPPGGEKQFQFKRMGDNNEELDKGDGFRMQIVSLGETQMQLKSVITYEGRPAAYLYNFVKK